MAAILVWGHKSYLAACTTIRRELFDINKAVVTTPEILQKLLQ